MFSSESLRAAVVRGFETGFGVAVLMFWVFYRRKGLGCSKVEGVMGRGVLWERGEEGWRE